MYDNIAPPLGGGWHGNASREHGLQQQRQNLCENGDHRENGKNPGAISAPGKLQNRRKTVASPAVGGPSGLSTAPENGGDPEGTESEEEDIEQPHVGTKLVYTKARFKRQHDIHIDDVQYIAKTSE